MRDPARPLLVRDRRFRDHEPPPGRHPERPARLDAIDRALGPIEDRCGSLEPRLATDEELGLGHDRSHIETLRAMEGRTGHLDPDTYCSPRSFDVARLAAGATIDLSLAVASGAASSGFALVRPPGHHAETNRPMGFCLVNQIALAAQVLRDRAGLERIAIVDWDVHHGNGTQEIFAAERDVLFISLHQYPHYPGSGSLDERGHGRGEGSTLNLPMPAGCGDAEYGAVFDAVVLPALREFRPEMILISAGFDAHARDPMASMELSNSAFGRFAAQLRSLADDICGGRLLLALEGGYDLEALGQSVVAVLESLCGPEAPQIVHPSGTEQAKRMIELYREAHGAHWASLRSRPSTAR